MKIPQDLSVARVVVAKSRIEQDQMGDIGSKEAEDVVEARMIGNAGLSQDDKYSKIAPLT